MSILFTLLIYLLTFLPTALDLPLQFPGCIPNEPIKHLWAYWIPRVVFEMMLVILVFLKVLDAARDSTYAPRVLIVLLRDSVVYFGGMLAVVLINLAIWASARVSS